MAKLGPADLEFGESEDAAIFDAFTKRVMAPISSFPAFKLGLVDGSGNIKKQPKTREEKRALSFLDRLALMYKKYNAARSFQIYNEYRLARLNPVFLRSLMRANSFRLTRYYDQNAGWDFTHLTEEAEKKAKKKKLIEENNARIKKDVQDKKELHDKIDDFFIEMEDQLDD